jgi:hypothetical protein
MSMVEKCSSILRCSIDDLDKNIYERDNFWKLWRFFEMDWYSLYIPHLDRHVRFGGFSLFPADQQYAYGGFQGTSVQQHMFCRHKIRLESPKLPCIKEKCAVVGKESRAAIIMNIFL